MHACYILTHSRACSRSSENEHAHPDCQSRGKSPGCVRIGTAAGPAPCKGSDCNRNSAFTRTLARLAQGPCKFPGLKHVAILISCVPRAMPNQACPKGKGLSNSSASPANAQHCHCNILQNYVDTRSSFTGLTHRDYVPLLPGHQQLASRPEMACKAMSTESRGRYLSFWDSRIFSHASEVSAATRPPSQV